MIVPMQKVSILCLASDAEGTLQVLRDLGVLHVTPCSAPTGDTAKDAHDRVEQAGNALETLAAHTHPHLHATHPNADPAAVDALIDTVCQLRQQRRHFEEQLANQRHLRHTLQPYGDFDPSLIAALAEHGIAVKLYHAKDIESLALPDDAILHVLSKSKTGIQFALIGLGNIDIDAPELHLPSESLSQLEANIAATQGAIDEIDDKLTKLTPERHLVERALHKRTSAARFADVHDTVGRKGPIVYMRGYCPTEAIPEVQASAMRHGWGLVTEEPTDEDAVPTLIRHPRWVLPIKAVLDILGILPGYDEIDVSAAFLVFFSLFFGMLVGDAGYGVIFLALAFLMRWKLPSVPKRAFVLLTITSLSTIVWGTLTGTWFGIENLPAFMGGMTVSWLRSETNIMELCFLIGALHLTLAHGWAAWRLRRKPQALAQLGWILSTWMMFFLARWLVLGYDKPAFVWPAVGVAAAFIALFMTPVRKLKTEWFGHAMLPLDIISNFVDVVSYVRLFAVGAASLAVAAAFNKMALGNGISGPVSAVIAALILFLGHALNLVMAIMGVMVHGVRLNTLEFSGHIGVEWKGRPYTPFAHADGEKE